MARAHVERVGWRRAVLLHDVLVGGRHQRRLGDRRTPARVRLIDEREQAGNVWGRHRRARDRLEQLARGTRRGRRRVAGQDVDAGGGDIGLDDVAAEPVLAA